MMKSSKNRTSSANIKDEDMNSKKLKYAVIKAKYRSQLMSGRYCNPGEIIVMFPRCNFESVGSNGKKKFSNSYVALNELQKYPEFAEIRQEIIDKYHIDPDTYTYLKTTWRK